MKNKNIFDNYSSYIKYAKMFENSHPNIYYIISLYAINDLGEKFQKDKKILNEKEIKEFSQDVMKLNSLNLVKPSLNEYSEFLENIFFNVDQEDKEGTVTIETALKFKMIFILIDVFKNWDKGFPNEEWKEKSNFIIFYILEKYCKYKTVDIIKSLKNGEIPKRGGPKSLKNEMNTNEDLNNNIQSDLNVNNYVNDEKIIKNNENLYYPQNNSNINFDKKNIGIYFILLFLFKNER